MQKPTYKQEVVPKFPLYITVTRGTNNGRRFFSIRNLSRLFVSRREPEDLWALAALSINWKKQRAGRQVLAGNRRGAFDDADDLGGVLGLPDPLCYQNAGFESGNQTAAILFLLGYKKGS